MLEGRTMKNSTLSRRDALRLAAASSAAVFVPGLADGDDKASKEQKWEIPKVPGKFAIGSRRRIQLGEEIAVVDEVVEWEASETAIIICDMWAGHPCRMAELRVARIAPRMNEVVSLARDLGAAIIHAPSSGVKHYEDTEFRQRMKNAKFAKPPVPIQSWCYHNKDHEGPWPIVDDVARGKAKVTGCDDPVPREHKAHDRHQHPAIDITGYDGVSDSGPEIYNFLEQEGRKNIVLMGVHTNMCVLGRPFGIRQQKYLGKNVALCRDLTDALYDPRDKPHVSHARGVELVIEHIERYWCPSLLGASLTRVIKGTAGKGLS
jgi:nicotinamidase-related amidase